MNQFYTLSNGLRIAAEVMPQVQSVSAGFFIRVGGMTETADETGLSHFAEHMIFKGTQKRTACEIVQEIDRTGGTLNAYTSDEYTCLYVKVPERRLETAIDVMCDMLFSSRFAEEDVELEKRVIGEEISLYEDSPEDAVADLLSRQVWGDCPAGRSILGTAQDLERITPSVLRAYTDRFYQPENMVFAIAGSFSLSHVAELLEQRLPRTSRPRPVFPEFSMEFHPGISVSEKDAGQTQLAIGLEGMKRSDPDLYALLTVNTLFGGGMSSRLFQNIREQKGLAYSIGSDPVCFEKNGLIAICAGISPENTERVTALILEEMERLCACPMTDRELSDAAEQMAGGYLLGLESSSSRMAHLGKELLLTDRVRTTQEILAGIGAVTAEDAARAAKRIFTTQRYAVAAAGAIDDWLKNA